jgi:hypothetical protein
MPRLFISYSRMDETFARRLATSLSQMGADIWIDLQNIPAGMKWSSAIQQGLDICDAMILIISPSSMASPNVEDEWQDYRDRNKVIVPVLYQPANVHYQLRRIQHINFHSQAYDLALSQLHAELWRNRIQLNPPPNVATQPIPRSAVGAQYIAPLPAAPVAPPSLPARPAPRRGGSNWLTLGCVGLVVAGVLLAGGAFLVSGGDFFGMLNGTPNLRQTATATVTATPLVTSTLAAQQGTVVVREFSANLRYGPGVEYQQAPGDALRGEVYPVVAFARSSDNVDWYLIRHPLLNEVWISGRLVTLQPSGFNVPPAVTVPPLPSSVTPTPSPTTAATSAPLFTATPGAASYINACNLLVSGQTCPLPISNTIYRRLEVRVDGYPGAAPFIELLDSVNNVLTSSSNSLVAAIEPGRNYTVQVSDAGGGTGTLTINVTLSP